MNAVLRQSALICAPLARAAVGRYTQRADVPDHRLVSVSDTAVRFGYKDYPLANRSKVMALDPTEFIRRFLLHVLPSSFMRIRDRSAASKPRLRLGVRRP